MAVARVVTISQTGTSVNDVPEMRLGVDVERAGEQPRRITFAQLIDLGSMPRAGERVYVMIDPKDPDRATLVPSPTGAGIKVTTSSADGGSPVEVDLGNDSVRDVVALSPRLREHGQLGIAKVVSISSTATTAKQLVLDIDKIGVAPRRVTMANNYAKYQPRNPLKSARPRAYQRRSLEKSISFRQMTYVLNRYHCS